MAYLEKIEKLLKDYPDAFNVLKEADSKGDTKFADLADGQYVGIQKYNNLENKYNTLNTDYNTLNENLTTEKQTSTNLQQQIDTLKDTSTKNAEAEKNKVTAIIKDLNIARAIDALGIKDELTSVGLKSMINKDSLTIDDNYVVTGLDEQISGLKDKYKDSFNRQVISTGSSVPQSNKTGQIKQYTMAELDNMSIEEMVQNIDAVNASISKQ